MYIKQEQKKDSSVGVPLTCIPIGLDYSITVLHRSELSTSLLKNTRECQNSADISKK